jgi:hypothetical protein
VGVATTPQLLPPQTKTPSRVDPARSVSYAEFLEEIFVLEMFHSDSEFRAAALEEFRDHESWPSIDELDRPPPRGRLRLEESERDVTEAVAVEGADPAGGEEVFLDGQPAQRNQA